MMVMYSVAMSIMMCLVYLLYARWYVSLLTLGLVWPTCAMDARFLISACSTPALLPFSWC